MQPDLVISALPVASLVPYAENARTHSPSQVAQIAASIAEFGFVNPVLVDADGVLIAGHGRVMAAKQLGLASVPVLRLGHLSPAQARALRLADNQIGGSGTTMIAAERTGRRAVLLELDPAYADVIVRRWQEATGEAAVLEGEDRTFGDIAVARGAGDHDVIQTAET